MAPFSRKQDGNAERTFLGIISSNNTLHEVKDRFPFLGNFSVAHQGHTMGAIFKKNSANTYFMLKNAWHLMA